MRTYFHNKKAMNYFIVTLIIGLLVFLTTVTSYASTQKKITNIKPYLLECKLTLGADVLTQDSRWLRSRIEDACYTVKLDNLNDLARPSYILRFVANRMAQSWDITWEGKKNLWDEKEGAFAQAAGYDCVMFFHLDYNHPKFKGIITKQEIFDYLIETDYPEKGMTYAEYIQGKVGNGAWFIEGDISPGHDYVISIMNPHEREVNIFKNFLGWPTNKLLGSDWDSVVEGTVNLFNDKDDVKTIIVFSELTWAQEQNCVYRGVEV